MPRTCPRLLVALPFVLLVAVTAGCADTAARSSEPQGHCPLPEERGPTPSPCVTFDWNQRLAENHAYRERTTITAEQKEAAAPRAEALAAALEEHADAGTTDDGLRAAAAGAVGVPPEGIEIRERGFGVPDRGVLVGGGEGRVCVNGTVDAADRVEVEVVGRTVEGTCLPGEGGH
ncbi:precorrin-3B C(17)-methyltransferase [Streptomyces sp. CB02400]|uniref:precorrin-3B C(17)-methyltransferase n=1 Tax=Streptomyces sp. CB02400 TaxID=1703944 RepID=UPI00093C162D|nr:precorrin-3B C(17)-methyltransferase [Streptomyces sp. CB02400]OKK13923.1 precorrin-3B C17-methyltransferase [Streptomyces sp. CB02400]